MRPFPHPYLGRNPCFPSAHVRNEGIHGSTAELQEISSRKSMEPNRQLLDSLGRAPGQPGNAAQAGNVTLRFCPPFNFPSFASGLFPNGNLLPNKPRAPCPSSGACPKCMVLIVTSECFAICKYSLSLELHPAPLKNGTPFLSIVWIGSNYIAEPNDSSLP